MCYTEIIVKTFFYLILNITLFSLIGLLGAFYAFSNEKPFSFGLDLKGGIKLLYDTDTSDIPTTDRKAQISALRDVVEQRVNVLGVSEPNVYTQTSLLSSKGKLYRLAVELPGIQDIDRAVEVIGKTPELEFKIQDSENGFIDTGITGALVKNAEVSFVSSHTGGVTNTPAVTVNFNSEGAKLFADLTKNNVGNLLGIFLDGEVLSTPVIREPIFGGATQITGSFTLEEAKVFARDLNFGALPVPIEISETQTVSASLGENTIEKAFFAGVLSIVLIILLLTIIYRLSGFLAGIALFGYTIIIISIFKFMPIVLTAAGIAGIIMSLGLAVDANVLIFERIREELKEGKQFKEALSLGFSRAWSSIKDANISTFLIALLLFWFGTSIVKGFALAFGIGVLVSFFSAIFLSRSLLWILSLCIKGKTHFFIIPRK